MFKQYLHCCIIMWPDCHISDCNESQSKCNSCSKLRICMKYQFQTFATLFCCVIWPPYRQASTMPCTFCVREACPYHYRWIFGKVPKGGGGVISDPKNFVAKFLAFETPIWGGHFRSKNFRSKKSQHFSQKRPGGVKGRLELFQKFIDNGSARRP